MNTQFSILHGAMCYFNCSEELGSALRGCESGDDTAGSALGHMDHAGGHLAEVLHYPGPLAVLVASLKRQGVRFEEADFPDANFTHDHQNVVVIRGEAAEFLHREYERLESGRAVQQAGEHDGLPVGGPDSLSCGRGNDRDVGDLHGVHAGELGKAVGQVNAGGRK